MLYFPSTLLDWVVATAGPAFIGLCLAAFLGTRVNPRYLGAFGLGIFLWFFLDTIQGSANLDVVSGLDGGLPQAVDVALFAAGALFMAYAWGGLSRGAGRGVSLGVLALGALAIGVHGFGEGSAFGSTAAQTSSTDILVAFGGAVQGAGYALHKVLEPTMVGCLYSAWSKGSPRPTRRTLVGLGAIALLFTAPSAAGAAMGYFIVYDSAYGFAFGAGTSLLVGALLARTSLSGEGPSQREGVAMAAALIVGLILIYATELLHF